MEELIEHWPVYAFYVGFISLVVILVGMAAVSKKAKVPGRLQAAFELLYVSLKNIFMSALGHGGEKHLPLAFTLFFYILFCNLLELIPPIKAPTSNPSVTLAMGVIVFFYVQAVGIRARGVIGYLKHFLGPMLALAILIFPIEILGELIKPFSLGMRLFGNIYAEDIMNELAATALPFVPMQILVYFLQIFTGSIQAFIFSILTCAYIGLMSEHHDDHGDEHDHHPHKETMDEKLAESLGSIAAKVP
jgi:F-type H+-transporting ATPase subunit a